MEDDRFPSGPWTGYYQHVGCRFRQDMDLEFRDGELRGGGIDSTGRFEVHGRYCEESLEVIWTKTYHDAYEVRYRGFREQRGIWGVWDVDTRSRGGFHIWPRKPKEEVPQYLADEDEVPVEVGAGPGECGRAD
ncbi:MAG: hypothetical protein IPM29_24125 [Planctomycetes bacterium]|nr:hypothetical protein [Planctomycetota bacterium]